MEVSAIHLFLGLLAVSLMTIQIDGAKEKSESPELDLGGNAAIESSHRIHKRCFPSIEAAFADCCRFEMTSRLYHACCNIYGCCPLCDITTDCYFKGRTYHSGESIKDACVNVTCEEGQWVSDGHLDDCCKKCDVWDDPHFISFDGWRFDFHGTCNYSITQKGLTFNPDFGVFSDFNTCTYLPLASCIGNTTFRDNPNTVITIPNTGGTTITANGVSHTVTPTIQPVLAHDVLAWTYANGRCMRFFGTQRLVVDYCFTWSGLYHEMFLYAHPALVDTLDGLCGHFNYFIRDDLTHRDTSVDNQVPLPNNQVPLQNAFGNSWKTSDQEPDCQNYRMVTSNDDPCLGEDLEHFIEICRQRLSSVNYNGYFPSPELLEIRIMSCAMDLCVFENAGSSGDEIEVLLSSLEELLQVAALNEAMTTPGARHPNNGQCEPCKGTCRSNGTCRDRCDSTEEELQQGGCKGEHCKLQQGGCKGEHCKCCIKKPTCAGDCGSGGICRSCSCQDDEEQIIGDCNLKDCLCCRKKQGCTKECRYRNKTYPCVPPSECKKKIKKGKCSEAGCTCCRRRK